jgi:hypothetical protein
LKRRILRVYPFDKRLISVWDAFAANQRQPNGASATPTTRTTPAQKICAKPCTIFEADTAHRTPRAHRHARVIDQMQFSSRSRLPERGRGMAIGNSRNE